MDEKNTLFQKVEKDLNTSTIRDKGAETGSGRTQIPAVIPPLSSTLEEAEQLVQKQLYTEAKLLLIKARIQTDDDAEVQIIDQALKNIETRQRQTEQGQTPINAFSETEALESAAALIEKEKYEEAISTLEKIEGQQTVPGTKVEQMKNLAIEKIINRDRNKAAQLYLQARQTEDRNRKKELLQSSLDILEALVEKYPSSSLIERINEHILIVKKALQGV
jgi:hypothetical protein